MSINTNASTGTYIVYNLTVSGKSIVFGNPIKTTTDFEEAKTEMIKHTNGVITSDGGLSPLQIVAATRGQAQSYPYRTGKDGAGTTLLIYSNKGLTSDHTYIPAHYMMYVYDYFIHNGRLIADIEIQGGRGYVEVNKIDVIPMIYIEKGIEIELGGKADYNTSKNPVYKTVPYQEEYKVEESGGVKEIKVQLTRPYPGLDKINLTYGIAPSYLETGKVYYSPDGIRFFTDRNLTGKSRVGGLYYSYFQWLPLRSMTNHKPDSFERLLEYYGKTNSVMMGQTHHFIEQGLKYGMNPVLIFQQANLESAYGTSKYARERNNLFGWGAVDSDPGQAYTYDNIGVGIEKHMSSQIGGYMKVSNWRHFGTSFGNKSAGITVKYASDPYYGLKVASMYYRMDKLNGYKDYNAYKLSLLEDGVQYSVKDFATDKEWYKTRAGLKNQVIINLERKNKKIKTIPYMVNSKGFLDPTKEFAYIEDPNSKIIDIESFDSEIIYEKPAKAVVTASSLHLRESFSAASASLGTIKNGTKLTVERIVEPKNVPWARTTYNGKTGFVHIDYLEFEKVEVVYKKGDLNGDGVINTIDGIRMKKFLAYEIEFNSEQFKAADINNDGKVNSIDGIRLKKHLANEKLIGE